MNKLVPILLSTLILVVGTSAYAKDDSVVKLNEALSAYTKASIDGDVDTIFSYTYPKLFDLAPREQMEAAITQAMNSEMAPKLTKLDTNVQLPLQKYSDGVFTLVLADSSMKMKAPESSTEDINQAMLGALQSQMGEGSNVTFDSEKSLFQIDKPGKLVAINEGSTGWKFIDYDQALAAAAASTVQLLPADIVEKLSAEKE